MPSGPEGDQEISEHTLMHPKYKTTGFYFSLVSLSLFFNPLSLFCFSVTIFSDFGFFFFQVNTGTYSGVLFLASFCIIVIYCTCNELVSFATFNSRSLGSRVGLEFLTYKNYRGFCQILSVYFINKCL